MAVVGHLLHLQSRCGFDRKSRGELNKLALTAQGTDEAVLIQATIL